MRRINVQTRSIPGTMAGAALVLALVMLGTNVAGAQNAGPGEAEPAMPPQAAGDPDLPPGEFTPAAEAGEAIDATDPIVEFDLPPAMDLTILVEWVAEQLGIEILYSLEELKQAGTVTIRPNREMRVSELYDMLETALRSKNYAMRRIGNWYTVIPAGQTGLDAPVIMDPESMPAPGIGEQTGNIVIELEHADPKDIQDILTPYLTEQGMVYPLPDFKTIIVTEYFSRLEQLRRLIKLADVPPKEILRQPIELQYTKAPDIAGKLANFMTVVNQPRTRIVPVRTVTPQGVKINYTTVKVQPEVQPFIDVDERTNRLMIYGQEPEVRKLVDLARQFDVQSEELQKTRAYPLTYLSAEDAWTALESLGLAESPQQSAQRRATQARRGQQQAAQAAGDIGGTGAAPRIAMIENTNTLVISATPEEHRKIQEFISIADVKIITQERVRPYPVDRRKAVDLADQLKSVFKSDTIDPRTKTPVPGQEGAPIIVAVEETNTIVVNATPSQHEQIGRLIRELDRTQPQVLLEAILVEITSGDDFDIGLELEEMFNVSGSTQLFGSTDFEFTTRSGTTGLKVLGSARPGGTIAYLNDDVVNVLLHAIEEKSKGRVLSKPRVLVENNEEGFINAIDEEPTVTVETLDNVTTRRFAGYEEAGTKLTITPRISEGDFLTLSIEAEISTFTGTSDDSGIPPPRAQRNVRTSIVVPDQRTIVIGGLQGKTRLESEDKIPLLGDIPLLGELFKRRSSEDSDRSIYLFVKASILRETTFTDLHEETEGVRDSLPPDLRDLDPQLSSEIVPKEIARMEMLRERRAKAREAFEASLMGPSSEDETELPPPFPRTVATNGRESVRIDLVHVPPFEGPNREKVQILVNWTPVRSMDALRAGLQWLANQLTSEGKAVASSPVLIAPDPRILARHANDAYAACVDAGFLNAQFTVAPSELPVKVDLSPTASPGAQVPEQMPTPARTETALPAQTPSAVPEIPSAPVEVIEPATGRAEPTPVPQPPLQAPEIEPQQPPTDQAVAESPAEPAAPVAPSEPIRIEMITAANTPSGVRITINDEAVADIVALRRQVLATLNEMKAQGVDAGQAKAIIAATTDVPASTVLNAMDMVKQTGIGNVAMTTITRPEPPTVPEPEESSSPEEAEPIVVPLPE